jgi:hypothetical protein
MIRRVDMTVTIRSNAAIAALVIGLWSGGAAATTLIADNEAMAPNAPPDIKVRGISRGPSIDFEEPRAGVQEHAPFDFKVKLAAHGGAAIDPAKVRVTYLKVPGIDLTERLRPFVTAKGIDMPAAEVPAGEHLLRIDVQDSDGRNTQAIITLSVAKRSP